MVNAESPPRRLSRFSLWLLWSIGGIGLAYVLAAHRVHLFEWLPFLIVLACPLMHIFGHVGHHHEQQLSWNSSQPHHRGSFS